MACKTGTGILKRWYKYTSSYLSGFAVKKMRFIKDYLNLILITLLSYFSLQPLFNQGFFPVHDDTQVARVYEMKTALADGMFPVRWVSDLGYNYGYPIFNFYGPLAYYVGGVFNLVGFDSLIATKIMIGLGTLLAGVSMYLFARELWGRYGGIISAILYMYAPYHALNIYVRGAIGELWAYAFIPIAFLGIYKVFCATKITSKKTNYKNPSYALWVWTTITAIAYAAIVVSHNLTGMMVTPFLFAIAVVLYVVSRWQKLTVHSYFVLLGLLLGIFLSAFYWLPVFSEMKFTDVLSVVGGGSDYHDHFVCYKQLWDSPWGFAGSAPGCNDGMSFRIGKFHIILALFSIIPLIYFRRQKTIVTAILLSIFGVLSSCFLMINNSQFIWDAIPQMAFFQFPWRFLVLTSFFTSFLGGAIFVIFQTRKITSLLLGALIIFVVLIQNVKLFAPNMPNTKTSADYTAKSEIIWKISKISDEYMPPGFYKPHKPSDIPKSKFVSSSTVQILSAKEKTQSLHAEVSAKQKNDLLVNLAYFPGWHVFVDHKQVWFKHFGKGVLIPVPQGKHTIDIVFLQTSIEHAGNALSIAGVFILLAGIISSRKERKRV
jgi:uncharacterized membrane protein